MGLVLDTGALIAFERGDRGVAALLEAARRRGEGPVTSSGCVGQSWRRVGSKQALLSRLLTGVEERGLTPEISRMIGELCGRAGCFDVVDAHVALLARDGDVVLTSDKDDLRALLVSAGRRANLHLC